MKVARYLLLFVIAASGLLGSAEEQRRGVRGQQVSSNENDRQLKKNKKSKEGKKKKDRRAPVPTQSILEIASESPITTTLATLLGRPDQADLVATLEGEGPFTIFAPTDDAFADLSLIVDVDSLDGATLSNILGYHVLDSGALFKKKIKRGVLETSTGAGVLVDKFGRKGRRIVLNDFSNVIITDIPATNGVIHVIDSVLLPNTAPVVGIIRESGFSSLLEALELTGLDAVLSNPDDGPFTILAPSDDAFANLLAEIGSPSLADLASTSEGVATLTEILLYHVILGNFGLRDLKRAGSVPTVLIENVTINRRFIINGSVFVDFPDLLASNGVVHGIDTVLSPPSAAVEAMTESTPIEDEDEDNDTR